MKINLLALIFVTCINSIGCNQKPNDEASNQHIDKVSINLVDSSAIKIAEGKTNRASNVEFYEMANNSFNMPNGSQSRWNAIYVQNFDKSDENVWTDMSNYTKNFPCEKGGFRVVFFFDVKNIQFDTGTNLEWNQKYDKNCVAGYWCFPNGTQEVKRFPMK